MEALDEQLVNSELPEQYTDKQIFLMIWTQPRKVFNSLQAHKQNKSVVLLIMMAALVGLLENFNTSFTIPTGYNTTQLVIAVLMVALAYVIAYLLSALLKWTGSWLGGKAEIKDVLRVTAYGSIPNIAKTVIVVPFFLFYLFADTSVNYFQNDSGFNYVSIALQVLAFILAVWQLVILAVGLSVAHEFGIGSAVLSIFFALLVLFIPLMVIAFIFVGSLF
jgi:hypothetical protein